MTNSQIDPAFLNDVLAGLRQANRSLPCKYLYDERGSALFDQICELDEYYLARTEAAILAEHAGELADCIGRQAMLIELGSGSSIKTRILLDHVDSLAAYIPVDISYEHLERTAADLREAYPGLRIETVAADFNRSIDLPPVDGDISHRVVYFPGSTLGNFREQEAISLLKRISQMVGQAGGLLIGLDLQKDPAVIEAAYNDSQGVTAAFSLNILEHINRELDADFDPNQFEHVATYDSQNGRVTIGVRSKIQQRVTIDGHEFEFQRGEFIHTEYSHKYTIDGFAQLAGPCGFELLKSWTDPENLFAVLYLEIPTVG